MKNALKAVNKTEDEIVVENYIVLFGDENERDVTGEYFQPDTHVKSPQIALGKLPVVWEHGFYKGAGEADRDDPLGYVDWSTAKQDDTGWFVRRVLNRRNQYIQLLDEAGLIDGGFLGTSSEADANFAKVTKGGKIEIWPLIADALTVSPFDPRMLSDNQLRAVKSISEQFPRLKAILQKTGQETGGEDAMAREQKNINMESDNMADEKDVVVDLSPVLEAVKGVKTKLGEQIGEIDKQVKAFETRLTKVETIPDNDPGPAKGDGVEVEVEEDEADKALKGNPFKSAGEFYVKVREVGERAGLDIRLKPLKATMADEGVIFELPPVAMKGLKAISGLSETVPADGGFLVGTDRREGVVMRDYMTGAVWGRAMNIPIGPNANGLTMNALDETSRASGSRWGGVLGYWLAEADEKTATKPKFRQIEEKLKKVAALVYATDELLEDSTALTGIINAVVPQELAFQKDDAAINGSGVGKPLGILNSPSLVTVAKESGQTAATVVAQNIINMWARRWARESYVWFINQDVEPQLHQLNLPVGTGGALVYMPPGGLSGSPYGTLYGAPVITIEQCQTLGTVGDIILAGMGQYLTISKGGVKSDTSIHVRFVYDESVYRFVERVDGMPTWNSALTPFKGSNTQSPFVVLATRS